MECVEESVEEIGFEIAKEVDERFAHHDEEDAEVGIKNADYLQCWKRGYQGQHLAEIWRLNYTKKSLVNL